MSAEVDRLVIQSQMEPELTGPEKELRIRFVDEFMYDRSPVAAAMRVGFGAAFATEFSQRFMGESFVRKLIREKEEQLTSNEPGQLDAKRKMVEQALLHEANYRGPGSSHSARVTALTNLAKLYGMEVKETAPEDENSIGGVMVVGAITDPDTWGASALNQQSKLKETVKD